MCTFTGCQGRSLAAGPAPEKVCAAMSALLVQIFLAVFNYNALEVFAYTLACKVIERSTCSAGVFNGIDARCHVVDFDNVALAKLCCVLFRVKRQLTIDPYLVSGLQLVGRSKFAVAEESAAEHL